MPTRFGTHRYAALCLFAGVMVSASGCATSGVAIEPRPGPVATVLAADADSRAEIVRRDPMAYLRAVAARCATLEQYTLTFTRVERRGLLPQLHGPERIQCRFRRKPFSVYMKWLDPRAKYGESVYVEGAAGNKVRFVPRHGLFGLTPGVTAVDLQTPVVWGESKRAMTDFGLERLMEQTLQPLEEAGTRAVLSYRGLLTLPDSGRIVHYLHLEYPDWLHKAPIQELYVDVQTDLPAGTILRLASGRIDAAYFYQDVSPNVSFTADDFLLDAERRSSAAAADEGAVRSASGS